MQIMKKNTVVSLKLMLLGLAITAGASALNARVSVDPGGPGCIINPDDKKGKCLETTEGTWKCVPQEENRDCTSSD